MLAWGLGVLVLALVAALLGFSGIAFAAATIAKIALAVGLGIAAIVAVIATVIRARRRR